MPTLTKTWTEGELLALPKEDGKYELVDGELTLMPPASFNHGDVSLELGMQLRLYARKNKLGCVVGGQTGFWMKSGNLLSPDVSFVKQIRLAKLGERPIVFFPGAPDLAVEVLSASETRASIKRKLVDYFASGTKMAWIVSLKTKSVSVYRNPDSAVKVCGIEDVISGEEVVPGFTLAVKELFEDA